MDKESNMNINTLRDLNKIKEYTNKHEEIFKEKNFGTKAIHCGQEPDIVYGTMAVPLHLATTYKQSGPNEPFGPYDYSRCGNPTRENLERLICGLHKAKHGLVMSSGCAVTTLITNLLTTGDHVVCIDDVYGGTQRIFRKVFIPKNKIDFTFTPIFDLEDFKTKLNSKTKLVWVESPTNPTLKVTDMAELIKTVKNYNKDIIIVCDNTFLSAYNYTPLDHGVDIVVESATKYVGGHSDVVMGILATNNSKLHDELLFIARTTGACSSPFDCYMAIRGIKTLHLRMERANSNALAIAKFLSTHDKIETVLYGGLESSSNYKVSKKNGYKGNGGVLAFYVKSDIEGVKRFFDHLHVITLAESLGAVESLIEHPETMTHASVPKEIREELGINERFIRMSTGCEDIEDLINDLKHGLSKI